MIPESLYHQIVATLPIPSVEALITYQSSVLLLKRNNDPAKNEWWLPGGRIRKGERLQDALHREVREETGLTVRVNKLIGVYSRIFPERHDITITYLCDTSENHVILNTEHSDYQFIRKIPRRVHPYLLHTLRDAGIFTPSTPEGRG
jgi:colanic acid biosynthesis protein WcaH